MKRIITFIMAGLLLGCAASVLHADRSRQKQTANALINQYKQLLPNIKFEDYIYGALAMNPDAKSQYDEHHGVPVLLHRSGQGQENVGNAVQERQAIFLLLSEWRQECGR